MRSRPIVFAIGLTLGVALVIGGIWIYRRLNHGMGPVTYELRDDILVHGNTNLKEIALTFDDGPRPELIRPILDLLGREGVKATFFVVGNKVRENPAIVRRMMNEGHEVANHTNSHPRLDELSESQIREEIAECGHAVLAATGARMTLFRPPGMRYDDVVLRTAQDLGYVTVHWNSAAQDFQKQDSKRIVQKILDRTQPGSVVLLHGHPDTVAALPQILKGLKSRGYRFLRVSQMLARLPRPVIVATNAYGVKSDLVAKNAPVPPVRLSSKLAEKPPGKPSAPSGTGSSPRRGVDVPTWN